MLAVLTGLRLLVAAFTPLSPDEAYYWVWSRAPALSYLDHPPMVAWFIAVGTAIAGDGALGVRLLAPLAAALGSVVLARAGDRLFPQTQPGIMAAALMNATLLFGVGAVTMTPDTPLLLFWTLCLLCAAETCASGRGWLVLGVAAGLALLSKYTAILLAPALLVWLLLCQEMRLWLARWQPWAAGAIAAGLFAPVLTWNATHGWASFAKQGSRAGAWIPARAAQFLAELLGGQVGLATPLIALLCGAGIFHAVRRAAGGHEIPPWGLLACVTAVPGLVFVEHALGDRVQANWPAILYPGAAIAAAMLGGWWSRLRLPAIALGFAITVLVWIQAIAAPLKLPRALDPTLTRLSFWPEFSAAVAARAMAEDSAFVAADNYGVAAELSRLMPDKKIPVLGIEPRWAFFKLPDAGNVIADHAGLLVRSARRDDGPDPADWSAITDLGTVTRGRDGVTAEVYRLYRVTGRSGSRDSPGTPVAEMPRPR